MNSRFFLLSTVAASICLTSAANAQVTKTGNAYSFRIRFVAGSVIKYKAVVGTTLSSAQQNLRVVYPVVQTVVGVHHGVGDVVVKSGPMQINNQTVGPEGTFRMQVDQRGKLVGGQIAANSGITTFPEKPIRPGQTWTASVPIAAAGINSSGAMVSTTYRFVRMTTFAGKSVAELALSFKAHGAMTVTGTGTAYVLAKDGNIVHSKMSMGVALGANSDPMSVNVEVSRS